MNVTLIYGLGLFILLALYGVAQWMNGKSNQLRRGVSRLSNNELKVRFQELTKICEEKTTFWVMLEYTILLEEAKKRNLSL